MKPQVLILDDPIPGPTDSESHRNLIRAVTSRRFRFWLWRKGWRKTSYTNRAGSQTTIMVRRR